jgi:hypothetical protein
MYADLLSICSLDCLGSSESKFEDHFLGANIPIRAMFMNASCASTACGIEYVMSARADSIDWMIEFGSCLSFSNILLHQLARLDHWIAINSFVPFPWVHLCVSLFNSGRERSERERERKRELY